MWSLIRQLLDDCGGGKEGGKSSPRVWLNTYWALHHIQGNKRYTMQWFYYPVHRRASLLTVQELTKNGESPIARLWPGGKSTWKYEMYWSGSCPHTVSTTRRQIGYRILSTMLADADSQLLLLLKRLQIWSSQWDRSVDGNVFNLWMRNKNKRCSCLVSIHNITYNKTEKRWLFYSDQRVCSIQTAISDSIASTLQVMSSSSYQATQVWPSIT